MLEADRRDLTTEGLQAEPLRDERPEVQLHRLAGAEVAGRPEELPERDAGGQSGGLEPDRRVKHLDNWSAQAEHAGRIRVHVLPEAEHSGRRGHLAPDEAVRR